MLNLQKTSVHLKDIQSFPIYSTIDEIIEGQGLAFVMENNVQTIKPSSATANEFFAGVAMTSLKWPTKILVIETLVAVATTLTLTYTPVTPSTDMRLYNVTESQALTYGSASNDNEYAVSGAVATLHSGDSGDTILAIYKRAVSVSEAELLFGRGPEVALRETASVTRQVDVIRKGRVATDQIIAADNWGATTAATVIKSTASGLLTTQSVNGGTVDGMVMEAPTAESPWLVVEYDATGGK